VLLVSGLLALAAGVHAGGALACDPGAASIQWNGQWYPGQIIAGPDAEGRCRVSYDGYGEEWHEWVVPSRLRNPGSAAETAGSGVDAGAGSSTGMSADGEWRCLANDDIPIGILAISGESYRFTVTMNMQWRPDRPDDPGNGSGSLRRQGAVFVPDSGPLKDTYQVIGREEPWRNATGPGFNLRWNDANGGGLFVCRR
jgi:hypothetical protein